MLYAMLKAPFARSLFLSSASRLVKPAVSRPALFWEARRTFLTTVLVLKDATEKPKVKAKKDPATKEKKEKTVKKEKKVVAEKVKNEKKVKVAKDPKILRMDMKLPFKRPHNAWQSFYFKYIEEHKQPGDAFAAHAQAASLAWKSLTKEEQQKYAASKEEREEYLTKAKEFRATDPTYKKAVKKFRKARRSPSALSAYSAFVKLNYDKKSSLSFLEQGAELGKRWRALSDEQKSEYKHHATEMVPHSHESAEAEK